MMTETTTKLIEFINDIFGEEYVHHHVPTIGPEERRYVDDCLKSSFVSTAGNLVGEFEEEICRFTKANSAIACSSGTAALHLALAALGVGDGDYVISQSFSFVATTNAISYTGARPIFVDIAPDTWSLCPEAVTRFLSNHAYLKDKKCYLRADDRQIKAILMMHTFGNPGHAASLKCIADEWGLYLVEDCAESLGSRINDVHTGLFGSIGCFSFNGNKIITTGGGGAVISQDLNIAERVRHLSTTARVSRRGGFEHDMVGYNYRMPNLNAALGLAQIKRLPEFIKRKRWLALQYNKIVQGSDIEFFAEINFSSSNYWLSSILFGSKSDADRAFQSFLDKNIEVRRPWVPNHMLPMYSECLRDELPVTIRIFDLALSLPSTPVELHL